MVAMMTRFYRPGVNAGRDYRSRAHSVCLRFMLAGIFALAPLVALSQEVGIDGASPGHETATHETSAHDGSAHETEKHTVGVFVGHTTEDRRGGLTLGLEYEYRVNQSFGVGLSTERVFGDIDTDVVVLPLAYHSGPWKLYTGLGMDFGEEGDKPLLRVGVEYGFHVGKYEISPQVDVDFVEGGEKLFVIGIVMARPF